MTKKTTTILMAVLMFVALGAMTACKSGGMAVTRHGQLLKINIIHPIDLPENGQDNLDVVISNRGVKDVKDILLDVELPPQLVVLDQTSERGVTSTSEAGTYHFTFGDLQPAESSTIRFKVRTTFGNMRETGSVKATAWQKDLTGEKLVETAVIKLRS